MEMNTKQALSQNVEEGATGIHYFRGDETMEITTADKTLIHTCFSFWRVKRLYMHAV